MSNSLFRKKSIAQIQADAASGFEHEELVPGQPAEESLVTLRRSLGTFDLTMLGIAAIIGAGIFAMVGQASHDGGPAVILLFIFAAIACGFAALCYAEFASKIPIAGSAYTYAYASFGELLAWIIGWDLLVEYAIGNIAVAISWSDYFTRLLKTNGLDIPAYFTMDYLSASRGFAENKDAVEAVLSQGQTLESLGRLTGDQLKDISDKLTPQIVESYSAWTTAPHIGGIPLIADLPALGIVFIITALVYIGIRESKTASNIMVALKLAVILLVIVVGAFYVNTENWNPFMPNGFRGVMSGVAAVFFAYIGFDALSTTAEECKDPYKTLPRGMILSLVICTALYVVLALVLTGMVSYEKLAVGDPLAFVFGPEGVNLPWLSGIIAVSAIIAIATVLLVFQLGQPRLWMAMSRDGLLPKIFSSIHPRFRTPWFSTILTGLMVAIPALFMNLSEVTDLSVIGTLFAFTIVCAGVLVKDREFAGKNRFVPYLSSRYIGPVFLIIGLLGAVYFHGVGVLNENAKSPDLRISTEKFEALSDDDKYSPFDVNMIRNGQAWSEGLGVFKKLFSIETSSENLTFNFKLPNKERSVSSSTNENIFVADQAGEHRLLLKPDETKAETSRSYLLWFTPFVSEQRTSFPVVVAPNSFLTREGVAELSITEERVEQPWLEAFSHNIPYIVFFFFSIIMAILCFIKRLSLIPVLGVMCCTYLMTELGWTNWFRFGIWLIVGLIVYFFYSFNHSKLHLREDMSDDIPV
jgi:APA family basic amino acid/polyamine antiporter